jgi:hypothetical protein
MIVFAQVAGRPDLTPEQCHRPEKSARGLLTRPAFGVERTRLCAGPFADSGWAQVMSAFDADRTAGQARFLDVHMFGGAANDPGRTETAYVHRDALFSVNYRNHLAEPRDATAEAGAAAQRWVDAGFDAIDPYSNGESYQNWMDPALRDWEWSYYAENYPRLAEIKTRYDPFRFFGFAQGIGACAAP